MCALSFISKIFTKYWNVMQTISSAKFEVIFFFKPNLSQINAIWHISQKKSLAIWSSQDYQSIKVYIFWPKSCSPLLSFLISLVDKVVCKTPTRLCKKNCKKLQFMIGIWTIQLPILFRQSSILIEKFQIWSFHVKH